MKTERKLFSDLIQEEYGTIADYLFTVDKEMAEQLTDLKCEELLRCLKRKTYESKEQLGDELIRLTNELDGGVPMSEYGVIDDCISYYAEQLGYTFDE